MGTRNQKQLIAYNFYDVDFDQIITEEEVEIVLKNIPDYLCTR